MVDKAILQRRAVILAKWPSMSEAAFDLEMRAERLSRIVWGRVMPKKEEARLLAWKLQKPISFLFPEKSQKEGSARGDIKDEC